MVLATINKGGESGRCLVFYWQGYFFTFSSKLNNASNGDDLWEAKVMHFNGGSVGVILLSPLFINLNYPLPFGVIVSFLFIVLKFYFKTKTCLGKFVVSFDIY